MLNRLTGIAVTALLLVSAGFAAPGESEPSRGFSLSGQFGVLSMNGTGQATAGAWDIQTGTIDMDVTNYMYPGLVRQEPVGRLGFGWDSHSLAVFGLAAGYRFNDRLMAAVEAEWANKREYGNDVGVNYDVAPGYPGYSDEYLDESSWIQATLGFSVDYAPFPDLPLVYLTAGVMYTRFQIKMELVEYGDYEDNWVNTRRRYDDVGGALGYTIGAGYLFAKKAGSREAFVETTWTYMPYGTTLGLSDGANLFSRKVELELGGFRLTSGIRFFISQLF